MNPTRQRILEVAAQLLRFIALNYFGFAIWQFILALTSGISGAIINLKCFLDFLCRPLEMTC